MSDKVYREGVVAVILDKDNRFLILQLTIYEEKDWKFAGGGREGDETAVQNLEREIKEELHLEPKDYEIIGQSKQQMRYDFPERIYKDDGRYFDGQILDQFVIKLINDSRNKVKIQEDEIRRYKWVKFDELADHLLFPNQYENAVRLVEGLLPGLVNKS